MLSVDGVGAFASQDALLQRIPAGVADTAAVRRAPCQLPPAHLASLPAVLRCLLCGRMCGGGLPLAVAAQRASLLQLPLFGETRVDGAERPARRAEPPARLSSRLFVMFHLVAASIVRSRKEQGLAACCRGLDVADEARRGSYEVKHNERARAGGSVPAHSPTWRRRADRSPAALRHRRTSPRTAGAAAGWRTARRLRGGQSTAAHTPAQQLRAAVRERGDLETEDK